jgi:hypothetical protein
VWFLDLKFLYKRAAETTGTSNPQAAAIGFVTPQTLAVIGSISAP